VKADVAPPPPPDCLEREFQAWVEACVKEVDGVSFHVRDMRGSDPGFPDLVIVLLSGKVLFRELKTATGKETPQQLAWRARLRKARQDVGVWRPADVERIRRELGMATLRAEPGATETVTAGDDQVAARVRELVALGYGPAAARRIAAAEGLVR
jgi:hypothetical protein